MRRLIASVLAFALMTMTTTATVATETEADVISEVQATWMSTQVGEVDVRDGLSKDAYELWVEASPDCKAYASVVFSSVFLFNLGVESQTEVAFEAVRFMNDNIEELDYACRIGM